MIRHWHLVQLLLFEAVHQGVLRVILAGAGVTILTVAGVGDLAFAAALSEVAPHAARAWLLGSGVLLASLMGPLGLQRLVAQGLQAQLQVRGIGRGAVVGGQFCAITCVLAWHWCAQAVALALGLAWLGETAAIRPAVVQLAPAFGPLLTAGAFAVLAGAIFRHLLPAFASTVAFAFAAHLGALPGELAERSAGFGRVAWRMLDYAVPDWSHAVTAPPGLALAHSAAFCAAFIGAAVWIHSQREA